MYVYCPSASRMTPLVSAEEDVPGDDVARIRGIDVRVEGAGTDRDRRVEAAEEPAAADRQLDRHDLAPLHEIEGACGERREDVGVVDVHGG